MDLKNVLSPLDVHLYHWAGLVVGVMCLASLTVQDRPGPGFPSSSSSRISEQRVRAERRRVSVAGAGGVCWAGPTPQLSDRLKLTHNLRDMSVSENSKDYNLIKFYRGMIELSPSYPNIKHRLI